MTSLLFAQVRYHEAMIGFVIISLFLLLFSLSVIFVVTDIGRRLILLGLLMLIASIGYGTGLVATPSAAAVVPPLGKVGALMVFGGMVHWLLVADSERNDRRRPSRTARKTTSDFAESHFESEE